MFDEIEIVTMINFIFISVPYLERFQKLKE